MIAPFFSDYMHIVFGLLFSKTKKEKKKVVMHGIGKLQKKSYFKTLRAKRATFTFE